MLRSPKPSSSPVSASRQTTVCVSSLPALAARKNDGSRRKVSSMSPGIGVRSSSARSGASSDGTASPYVNPAIQLTSRTGSSSPSFQGKGRKGPLPSGSPSFCSISLRSSRLIPASVADLRSGRRFPGALSRRAIDG
jgi:hypothetical protein